MVWDGHDVPTSPFPVLRSPEERRRGTEVTGLHSGLESPPRRRCLGYRPVSCEKGPSWGPGGRNRGRLTPQWKVLAVTLRGRDPHTSENWSVRVRDPVCFRPGREGSTGTVTPDLTGWEEGRWRGDRRER